MSLIQKRVSSQTLRELFFDFFEARGHTRLASGPLIPIEDNTLLFTNAGMVPLKNIFTGQVKASYASAVSTQKCMRAGGKHNDLENVGYTARHHTFFEMLGNFSFGSYFKREAIQYAWEFLTQVLKLPTERLWVTVFKEDAETESIWLNEMKIDPNRFSRCEANDNFWSMGDTGPCGPCTEIFYDHGPSVKGGPPGSDTADGDRYMEIWNLVFMQFEKTSTGELIPLPKPCVDTGMGLERLTAVMQGVTNNYDTDLFQLLIQAISNQFNQAGLTRNKDEVRSQGRSWSEKRSVFDIREHGRLVQHRSPGSNAEFGPEPTISRMSSQDNIPNSTLYVIADHLRATIFLMAEGIYPGREGRAYVLRRIIRRAARHGYQGGLRTPFLYKLVSTFISQMGSVYPDLISAESRITEQLLKEEQQFEKTLHYGMKCFEEAVAQLYDAEKNRVIPGETIFKLYDTYGFPVDLTSDLAREKGLEIDQTGFEAAMRNQQRQSHASHQFSSITTTLPLGLDQATQFTGYQTLKEENCKIIGLIKEGKPVTHLNTGDSGQVILDHTPFYAESGGQVGDQGFLRQTANTHMQEVEFEIVDTQKQGEHSLHIGKTIKGSLSVGQILSASVDAQRRYSISLNHSATHLLHVALRQILGNEVQQRGSLVSPTHLRFDFSYSHTLTAEQIDQIELLVNQCIWENLRAHTEWMSQEEAKQSGAIALFSEKYHENVRVLKLGDFSTELCGGTHVNRTSEIGLFKITSISSIASGIRRIEALTGQYAFQWMKSLEQESREIGHLLKTDRAQNVSKLQKYLQTSQVQTDEINQLRHYFTQSLASTLLSKAQKIGEMRLIIEALPAFAMPQVREVIDQLKSQQTKNLIILACPLENTLHVQIGVSKDSIDKIKANEFISILAPLISGKGGGRPDFAQMKGHLNKPIEAVLESIRAEIIDFFRKSGTF